MRIFTKFVVLAAAILAVFGGVLAWLLSRYHADLYAEHVEQVSGLARAAETLVADFAGRAGRGEMPVAEAQERAKAGVRALRYGEDGYFWINDLSPRMVMHATKPELDGKV